VAKCSKRVEPGDAAMSDLRAMRDLPMAHPTRAPHHLDAFALGQGPVVGRVNPPGAAVAQGTVGAASLDREGKSNVVGADGDVFDMQRLQMREKLLGTHGKPS